MYAILERKENQKPEGEKVEVEIVWLTTNE